MYLDACAGKIGTVSNRGLHQVLQRLIGFLRRNLHRISGNNVGSEYSGIGQPAASERSLNDQLLLTHQALRFDERLPAGGQRCIRTRNFDGSLSALIHLVAVVFIQSLGQAEGFLLYLDVLV